MCRQFMTEVHEHRKLCVWSPQIGRQTLGELLPHSFGPADLGKSTSFLSSQLAKNPIMLPEDAEAREVDPALAQMVEDAAQRAHAPYTSSYAGAVLRVNSGETFSGSSVESAAFNPSVSPLQVALVALFSQGYKIKEVELACLGEDPESPITYKGSDGALLDAIAPWARLWLIPLTTTGTGSQ